jgi:DNA polymerase
MERAHVDFEWRSPVNLKVAGLYVTAEHPETRPWCMSWRVGTRGPIYRWLPGGPDPRPLLDHVAAGRIVVSHNASAERVTWNQVVRARIAPHWPELRIEQQDCTMARCALLGLPESLEVAAVALRAEARKDTEGKALMRKLAKPRKTTPDGDLIWHDDPAELEKLYAYCDQDVEAETAIDQLVSAMSQRERAIWILDQKINDRGIKLDVPVIRSLMEAVEACTRQLDAEMHLVTDGALSSCSQAAALAKWITSQGVPCTSVAASEHEDILWSVHYLPDDSVGRNIRHALELRERAAKASTAKLKRMLACVNSDGRSRGTLHYCGTIQRRWSGRLWQPHNLKRVQEEDGPDIEIARSLAAAHLAPVQLAAAVNIITGREPMEVFSRCLRSMIVAEKGHTLVGGDLTNIEGRINAWLWGEKWKLAAFRDFDAKRGPDLYRMSYSRSFGTPIEEVTGSKRQVGKVQELSLGYQGSVGAYINMGKNYGVRPEDIRKIVQPITDCEVWNNIAAQYKSSPQKHGLPLDQWTALKIVVKGWRTAHPLITQGWWDLQDAAVEAVSWPGRIVPVAGGRVRYLCSRGFLWCVLPSSTVIAYCRPRIVTTKEEVENEDGTVWERRRQVVHYEGSDAGRWHEHNALYGGQQCAHVVSGIARDIMADCMLAADRQGFPLILTVHDELLAEVPIGSDLNADLLCEIMSQVPACIDDGDLPMAAKTWQGPVYVK